MTWDEVGDGCYRRRYKSFDLNIGVVRGSDSLLVLDTRQDLPKAEELLDDLRVFGAPVRWVVNSHYHFDHTFGNQRFVERSRGEPPHGPAAEVSPDLELWGHEDLPRMLLDDEEDMRSALLHTYGDAAGAEFDRVTLMPPDHLVTHRHVLDLGDRGVELAHFGRGHTSNDLVVAAPASGVVFAGDLLEESGPPAYGMDCYPLDWPATAAALVAQGATTFVPGHGDVMATTVARDQSAAIADVAQLVRELHASGVSVRDAVAELGKQWPFGGEVQPNVILNGYAALR